MACRSQQIKATEKRRKLTEGEEGIYWARMNRRRGYSKITPDIRSLG